MSYRSFARNVGNAVRLAEVAQVLLKHGFADVLRRLELHEGLPAKLVRVMRSKHGEQPSPETLGQRLNAALMELGPTFIKLGQVLSTRPDLLDKKLCRELGRLQDAVTPTAFETIRPVIEASLACTVEEAFAEFDTTPIASASLSQVYRARLHEGGEVAVKVLRPGVRATVQSDVQLLYSIAAWIEKNVEEMAWLEPQGVVRHFERSVHREMDFTIEARTIQRFHANFRDVDYVQIPKVHEAVSSAEVLAMDWIDGVRVDDFDAYEQRNCQRHVVALHGCAAVFKQVFEDQFFHADPHPGNVFITHDNKLAFIDYGMVGHLEKGDDDLLMDLLHAVLHEDAESAVRVVLSLTGETGVADAKALEEEVADYLAFEAQSIINSGQVGKALERITDVLSTQRLRLPARFMLLIKALATIESAGHALDPELNLVPLLRPYVEDLVRKRHSPEQVLLRGYEHISQVLAAAKDLPFDAHDLIQQMRKGAFKTSIDIENLARFSAVFDRSSNRIAFAMVTGSLIVGSSILMTTELGDKLGLAGYVGAGVLGLFLLISILRSKTY